jgi:hypothetical protein
MKGVLSARTLRIAAATVFSAVAFWLSVHLNEVHEVPATVSLTFLNVPEGYALRTAAPREVHLNLQGEGWKLAGFLWGKDLACPIDLADAGKKERVMTVSDISRELGPHPGVLFSNMSPDTLFVAFEPYTSRKVPVILNASISCSDGYGLSGAPRLVPDSVTVGGASSIVAGIEQWRTRATSFEQLKAPLSTSVALDDSLPFLLSFSPPSVDLLLNVQPFAEKTLPGIPIRTLSVPANRELILIPPRLEIVVRGAIDQLASLTQNACGATVDFNAIEGDSIRVLTPVVDLPPGLTLIAMRPSTVQYVIRRRL